VKRGTDRAVPRRAAAAAAAVLLALGTTGALAQSVALSGSLGDKALLVIDGQPHTLAVGASAAGVKLLSVGNGGATVEVKGQRLTLAMGASPVSVGGGAPAPGSGARVVLTADAAGHFFAGGTINGKNVRFLVDTGATTVGIGQGEADRLGLDYKHGSQSLTGTAAGVVPVYHVSLSSVRIGDVQLYDVDATVLPSQMPFVLLGNTVLNRFQMKRENDTLTLDKRY
jgi:aspartyl protease family protein